MKLKLTKEQKEEIRKIIEIFEAETIIIDGKAYKTGWKKGKGWQSSKK